MPIFTVRGPIAPEELGFTSMHEHLLIDGRQMARPNASTEPVTMGQLGSIKWDVHSSRDNLVVDDGALVARGLRRFEDAGGAGVVDLTNIGLGRRVESLKAIAESVGVHIMIGCGWYVADTHPEYIGSSRVGQLASMLRQELEHGVGSTGIRPALIGEVGTSANPTPGEFKVLEACADASSQTGATVNVHIDPLGYQGLKVIEALTNAGMTPARIVLSHMDEALELQYHLEVAATGATLAFDTFGQESYWSHPRRDPTDEQRFEHLAALIAHGLEGQVVLGCDVYAKSCHADFGGMGYEHLPSRVTAALLERFGVSEKQLEQMTVHNPRALLDRPVTP